MSTGLINPYFEGNPAVSITTSRILCLIGAIFALFGLYCIIFKSPRDVSSFYKILNIQWQTYFLIFQINLSFLAYPVNLLPYSAFYPSGLLSTIGLPSSYQLILLILNSCCCGTSAFLPFWYRMEQLLSTHNLLKHRLLRIPFYFCMSFGSYVLVPPCWFILLYFMDQQATKEALVAKMGLYESYKEILFDNRTLAVNINFDGCSQGGLVSIFRCCLMGSGIYVTVLLFVAILGCSTVSFILLQKERSTMSEKTKKIHRQFLISLLAQVSVTEILFVGNLSFIGALGMFRSIRADFGNWSAILLAQSSPAGSVLMILMSKTYRNFLFNLLGISGARRAQEVTVDSRRENGSPGEEEPRQRQE